MRITQELYEKFMNNSINMKTNKYKNKKILYNDIKFDSIKEKNHYIALKQLQDFGVIKNLQLQVKYELQPSFKYDGKTIKSINYIADFVYEKDGKCFVEDVKGFKKKEYQIKKKMFLYKYKDLIFKEII